MAAYPSGFQPYRQLALHHRRVGERRATTGPTSRTTSRRTLDSYNHPNAANEPRIPGIFPYYSRAEDELVKGLSSGASAQEIADAIAAAWEELTDQIGRDQQLALYRAVAGPSASERWGRWRAIR